MNFCELFLGELEEFFKISFNQNLLSNKIIPKNRTCEAFLFKFTLDTKECSFSCEYGLIRDYIALLRSKTALKLTKNDLIDFKSLINDLLYNLSLKSEFRPGTVTSVIFERNSVFNGIELYEILSKNQRRMVQFSGISIQKSAQNEKIRSFEMVKEIKVPIKLRVANARLSLNELLDLAKGDEISLQSNEIIELMCDNKIIAKATLVRVGSKLGIKIIDVEDKFED